MRNFKVLSFSLLALGLGACSSDDNSSKEEVIVEIKPDAVKPLIMPKGFYVANEESITHDKGTVNFFSYTLEPEYRVYRKNNEGETFGITTQYGVIYGDYHYYLSKQGNRLVVTDKDLKKVLVKENLGGDGRAFVGATETKGYISTGNGVFIFDIKKLEVLPTAISGVSGQVGNMVVSNGKLYAVGSRGVLFVIDVETDELLKTIEGGYAQLTIDKDGIVWAGKGGQLVRVDPFADDALETIDIPGTSIQGQWGAWNAGSLTASMKEPVLYWNANGGAWNGGNRIAKYNTETKELDVNFYTLGEDKEGAKLDFYGAGMRVDPFTDNLVLTIKREYWGENGSHNWVRLVNAAGAMVSEVFVAGGTVGEHNGNYWFPAVPFFDDVNAPQILLNQIILAQEESKEIDLRANVIDQDTPFGLTETSVVSVDNTAITATIEGDKLIVKATALKGKSSLVLRTLSQGKVAEKTIEVVIK